MLKLVVSILLCSSLAMASESPPGGPRAGGEEPAEKRHRVQRPEVGVDDSVQDAHRQLANELSNAILNGDVQRLRESLAHEAVAYVLGPIYSFGEMRNLTALGFAVAFGTEETARALLTFTTQRPPHWVVIVFAGTRLLGTPLHIAARLGRTQMIRVLLTFFEEHVANPYVVERIVEPNIIFGTPLYHAAMTGRTDCVFVMLEHAERCPQLAELLLARGDNGEDALEIGAALGNLGVVKMFLDAIQRSPDLAALILRPQTLDHPHTALHAAARAHQTEVIELLGRSNWRLHFFRSPELLLPLEPELALSAEELARRRNTWRTLLVFFPGLGVVDAALIPPDLVQIGRMEAAAYVSDIERLHEMLSLNQRVDTQLMAEMFYHLDPRLLLARRLPHIAAMVTLRLQFAGNPFALATLDAIYGVWNNQGLELFKRLVQPGCTIFGRLLTRETNGRFP